MSGDMLMFSRLLARRWFQRTAPEPVDGQPAHQQVVEPAETTAPRESQPIPRRVGRAGPEQSQAGSISIEAVLIIPAFLLFLVLVAAIGRVAVAHQQVHAAVVAAARTASLQSSPQAGQAAGLQAAQANLARPGLTCVSQSAEVDAAALALPPGQSGLVTARVTCLVSLADLTLPGVPGYITVSESFSAATDPYVDR